MQKINQTDFRLHSQHIILLVVVGFVVLSASAVTDTGKLRVTYSTIVNGETVARGGNTIVIAGATQAKLFTEQGNIQYIPENPTETSYIDFKESVSFQVADLFDGTRIYTETAFSDYPVPKETGETEEILGYLCKKMKTSLRSNTLEIWYTDIPEVKGTPQPAYGVVDGLVLKVVRNGNYGLIATQIEEIEKQDTEPIFPGNRGERVDAALYRHRVTSSLITSVEVFTEEQINWGSEAVNPEGLQLNKSYRYAGGTIVVKKVNLPVLPPGYQVFAELESYSNGDAYDRTGTVFVIHEDKELSFFDALNNGIESVPGFMAANGKNYRATISTPDFSPAIELVRFFTPFGVGHFNDQVEVYGQEWEDVAYYKQEVTDLLPALQGEVWIGVFIGNYDKGGHRVSLNLKYYPGSRTVQENKRKDESWVYPLFNTLNIMEMAGQEYGTLFDKDSLQVEFDVPDGARDIKLRYITTGHGGWGGGDE